MVQKALLHFKEGLKKGKASYEPESEVFPDGGFYLVTLRPYKAKAFSRC